MSAHFAGCDCGHGFRLVFWLTLIPGGLAVQRALEASVTADLVGH